MSAVRDGFPGKLIMILPVLAVSALLIAGLSEGYVSINFPRLTDPNGNDVGIGRFIPGQRLSRILNVTFDEPLPLEPGSAELTLGVYKRDSRGNWVLQETGEGVPMEKTLDFLPLIRKSGQLQGGEYSYRPKLFNFSVTIEATNVSSLPETFTYTYNARRYEEPSATKIPENCGEDECEYWSVDYVTIQRSESTGGQLTNYCSGPDNFNVPDTAFSNFQDDYVTITSHNCSESTDPSSLTETTVAVMHPHGISGVYEPFDYSNGKSNRSYRFSSWLYTTEEKELNLRINVNHGMSVYVDGIYQFSCGCGPNYDCSGSNTRECQRLLTVPTGMHRMDVYLYCRDGCYLDVDVIDPDEETFMKEFDGAKKASRDPEGEWVSSDPKSASVRYSDNLKQVGEDSHPLSARKFRSLQSSLGGVGLSMRMACGNSLYHACVDNGGGSCMTDENGWIKGRVLPGKDEWELINDVGGDAYKITIEPFDHGSLEGKGRSQYADSKIGGIYQCKPDPTFPNDYTFTLGNKLYNCDYLESCGSSGCYINASWDGREGEITVYHYDSSSTYVINYLPYDGYGYSGTDPMDFTMFPRENPKVCAFMEDPHSQDKVVNITNFNNTGTCDPETTGGCCVCIPGIGCRIECEPERKMNPGTYTLPFSPVGDDWYLEGIEVYANSSDEAVEITLDGSYQDGWSVSAELKETDEKTLFSDIAVPVDLFRDFGLHAPDSTGKYYIKGKLTYQDGEGNTVTKKDDGNGYFLVSDCLAPGSTRSFFNSTAYPNVYRGPLSACAVNGTQYCTDSFEWAYNTTMDYAGEPSTEVCNGVDDDCNGWVDDIMGMDHILSEFIALQGKTTPRQITRCGCFGAAPGPVYSTDEICDGIDNDCNGVIDDKSKTIWVNSCTQGVYNCQFLSGNAFDFCSLQYNDPARCGLYLLTVRETVNLTRNTCTDAVAACMSNERLPSETSFSYSDCMNIYQSGNCMIEKQEIVVLGDLCDCLLTQGAEDRPEVCDGKDNDCDGIVDNTPYSQTCGCAGARNASLVRMKKAGGDSSCNGIDDDCDGTIDEDSTECACTGKKGADVIEIKTLGQEICDGMDNNCNDLKDEGTPGLGDSCGTGNCENGMYVCSIYGDNDPVCNTTVPPEETFLGNAFDFRTSEECDFVDNDCDYSVDEECGCTPSDMGVARICGYTSGVFYQDLDDIGRKCAEVEQTILNLVSWVPEIADYRKGFTLTNNQDFGLDDYPVRITLNTRELVDGGKMRPDGGDLRISGKSNGTASYYSWYNTTPFDTDSTDVWFRTSIPADSSKDYYLYYGKPSSVYSRPEETSVRGMGTGKDTLLLCHFDGTTECQGNIVANYSLTDTFVGGKTGMGVFIGPDSYVSYPVSANFNRLRGTVEMWVKQSTPSSSSPNKLITVRKITGEIQFLVSLDGNEVRFDIRDASDNWHWVSAEGIDSRNEFYHIAASWDTLHGMNLTLNGELVASRDAVFGLSPIATEIIVGNNYSSPEGGELVIDELAIYSRPISSERIRMDMLYYGPSLSFGNEETLESISRQESSEDVYARCEQFYRERIEGSESDPERVSTILSLCESLKICDKDLPVHPLSACRLGTQLCVGNEWAECSGGVTPSPEVCDNVDNDCNGIVDDVLVPDTCACYMGNHSPGELAEACNGVDDDCNGMIDDVNGGTSKEATHCGCYNRTVNITRVVFNPENMECNAIDDNCNGRIDEGVSGCACSGTVFGPSEDTVSKEMDNEELCNGVDDNCDGNIDEKFRNWVVSGINRSLGRACGGSNFSRCFGGEYVCHENGMDTVCDSMSNEGVTGSDRRSGETCNDIDDDCNGIVDDILDSGTEEYCGCYNRYGSDVETCNGKDDDCNGLIDDGINGCACTTSLIFSLSTYGEISNMITQARATQETCNNVDDNCNGRIDEGMGLSCFCSGGYGGNAAVRVESCNGVDDDCNGIVDDVPFADSCGCYGGASPSRETCNTADDDCDGLVDEDWPELGSACGFGECLGGAWECVPGGTDAVCSTMGGSGDRTSSEACDNVDNDCDGAIDEGCPCDIGENRSCGIDTGACSIGYQICLGESWGGCIDSTGPVKETCNGLDDNCNGVIDDLGGGISAFTTGCGCFGGGAPAVEVCNGIDDDCDGTIDDVNGGDSVESTMCACYDYGMAKGAGVEVCDNVDNDCNGIVDDIKGGMSVQATGCGCFGENGKKTETCNGIDDDCDGEIDEGYPNVGDPCGGEGVCAGVFVCSEDGSSVACSGIEPGSETEICDGKDNDCDGTIDEGCYGNLLTSCENGIKDGDEEGVDCGGSCPDPCLKPQPYPESSWIFVFIALVVVIIIAGLAVALSGKKRSEQKSSETAPRSWKTYV